MADADLEAMYRLSRKQPAVVYDDGVHVRNNVRYKARPLGRGDL